MANANEPVIESGNPVNPSVTPSQLDVEIEIGGGGISVEASVEDLVAEGLVREMGLKERLPADKDDEQPAAADQAATGSAEQARSSSDEEEIEGSGSSSATVLEGAANKKKIIKKKEKLSSIKVNNDA